MLDTLEAISEQMYTFIQLYESRKRQREINKLAIPLIKDMKKYFRARQPVMIQRIERAWKRIMEKWQAGEISTKYRFTESGRLQEVSRIDMFNMELFDLDEEEMLLVKILTPHYREAGIWGARQSEIIISNYLRHKIHYRGSQEWIETNAIQFGKKYSRSIADTTNEAIRFEISAAIEEGESLAQLIDRIQEVYHAATTYRAEMIGRTEIGRAYNMSNLAQDVALGLTSYDWGGCNKDCLQCGPFMDGNPHSAEEIETFIIDVHPNCAGNQSPNIPPNYSPPAGTFFGESMKGRYN